MSFLKRVINRKSRLQKYEALENLVEEVLMDEYIVDYLISERPRLLRALKELIDFNGR